MNKRKLIEQVAADVTKELIDRGKIIEAGFAAYRMLVIHQDAPSVQVSECRLAFMAGADHLFSSIMVMMDADTEPTDHDLRRMDQIHAELEEFRAAFSDKIMPARGSA